MQVAITSVTGVVTCQGIGWQVLCVDTVGHPYRNEPVTASLVTLPHPAPPGGLYVPKVC